MVPENSLPEKSPSSAISQTELAKRMSLSQATVSRALRNDHNIARATREKVWAAAREFGYRPSPIMASRRAKGHSRAEHLRDCPVAILFSEKLRGRPAEAVMERVIGWYRPHAHEMGFRLHPYNIAEEKRSALAMSNFLFNQGIQGVIFGMLLERYEWFDDFDFSKFVLVSTDPYFENRKMPCVRTQVRRTMAAAYRKAWNRGYRKIGGMVWEYREKPADHAAAAAGFLGEQRQQNGQSDERLLFSDRTWEPASIARQLFLDWVANTQPDAVILPNEGYLSNLDEIDPQRKIGRVVIYKSLHPTHPGDDSYHRQSGFLLNWHHVARHAVEAMENAIRLRRYGFLDRPIVISIAPEWFEGESLPSKY